MNDSKIIPIPKEYMSENKIKNFIPQIQCEIEQWLPLAEAFAVSAKKIFGITFTEGSEGLQILLDENMDKDAYVVDTREKVQILAGDAQGCAYALATLLQLMDGNGGIEVVRIEDWPDKDYRGLMVDVAREWHPLEALLHYVDICFFYKVKYLHLHFMDDQRYTLPSDCFPALATKGESYSKEEIRQLCNYAKNRGVVLVPEIEMPGHAKSLIRTYPDVFANRFDEGADTTLVTESGVVLDGNVICAGNQDTFLAVTQLIDEVLELFPDVPYIHLGGDEVKSKAWCDCPVCRDYMERKHLRDAEELYCDFLARVTEYVLSKCRQPVIWEGFAKKYAERISKEVVVIAWESEYQYPDELIENGFEVINCSWKPLYVIPAQLYSYAANQKAWSAADILKWNVYEWQNWCVRSAATLNPFHLQPTEKVIGAQLCAWEMTYECGIANIVVRLAALSERTWSIKRYCSDEAFWQKLRKQMVRAFRLISDS